MDIVIDYIPNKKQELFHRSNATETVYGGAKGGGKSCALVMEAMTYALEYPKAKLYLFRETYSDLEETLIYEWKEKIPSELYKFNETKRTATMINGSIVYFRYVSNLDDAKKYQGRSIDFIGIDELTKHTEDVVQELLSCLRSPLGHPPRARFTCNPGGIGHYWVKRRYITGTNYGKESYIDLQTNNKVEFIPATVYDNDVLMKNDPSYIKRLENLPHEQRLAYLYGDWDIFEGRAFEKFNEIIHVIDPFKIPSHWRRWISIDNGYTDPFVFLWFCVDEVGTVYCYREFTREYEDEKLTYKQQAERALELSKYTNLETLEEEYEKIDFIVVGHDAWQRHPLTRNIDTPDGKSILDYYSEGGLSELGGYVKPITDRRLRKATVIEYLEPFEDQEGKLTAKVKIFRNCKKVIETLPLQINDNKDPEKVKDGEIDHWYDAFGYGILTFHAEKSEAKKEIKSRVNEHKQSLVKKNKFNRRL